MATVALISCVKTKRPGIWPARELYNSTWFVSAMGFATRHSDRIFILSAKHGLLHPDQRVEAYEETLKVQTIAERRKWALSVARQLDESAALEENDEILWLAGQRYREFLGPLLRAFRQHCPLKHLRQGEQVQWLQLNQ